MPSVEQLQDLVMQFDRPQVQAILLVGSLARGEAGPYSDVDLLRLVDAPLPATNSQLWQNRLVNVSDADVEIVETWFSEPEKAVEVVSGLRQARVLLEKDGSAQTLLERARAFVWTPDLQAKADVWASAQLVGWAEEAHKGLAGLQSGNIGQLLHAQFGLSWGLAKTIRVQRGLLSSSDNNFLTELQKEFAGTPAEMRWLELLRGVYGLTGLTLVGRVRAGLELYCLTVDLLSSSLQPHDRPAVEHTVLLIRQSE